jgi:hypothetical protein
LPISTAIPNPVAHQVIFQREVRKRATQRAQRIESARFDQQAVALFREEDSNARFESKFSAQPGGNYELSL